MTTRPKSNLEATFAYYWKLLAADGEVWGRNKPMRLSLVEELTIRRKRRYKNYWRDKSDWYWLYRLLQEVAELTGSLLGIHKDSPRHELEQIASICMNWIER